MKNAHHNKVHYLILMCICLCGTGACAQNEELGEKASELTFVDLFDSTANEEVACYRIPAITKLPNGSLFAAIDERVPSCNDLRGNPDINIVARRSTDNGVTWSEIETIADFPLGQSASDPSLIVNELTADLFLFYNYMNLDTEPDVYYLHVMKSTDNGMSWSEPEDITSQITLPGWHADFKFITSGRGIQTSSGRLLHTLVNLENGLHLFGSDDHGESWFLINTPIKPGDESKVVELRDGSWMVNSRVNGGGQRHVHISTDEGQTWASGADSALVDPGCNGSIIRYAGEQGKNGLLFSNAKSSDARENMTVRMSHDEGQTWTEGKTIYAGSAAYSSLVVLDNGEIGLFFEKDEYQRNVFVRFTLDWLMNEGE